MRTLSFGIVAAAVMFYGTAVLAGLATPGSGSATISPAAQVTAGSQGMWTIDYANTESFSAGGIIEITIPTGWTPPQDGSPSSAGYVTVSSDHGGANPALSIAGQIVTITVDNLAVPKHVFLVYGDSTGANPGAVSTAQTNSQSAVEFLVRSDPDGLAPAPVASSPTLDVVAGPITQLVYATSAFIIQTTGEAGPLRIQAQDQFGNPSPVPSDQQINLTSTSPQGSFSMST
ncbi:MAG: hypothetical protein OEN01_05290 [Candidatus Krumholzibacteria bacterium]|nr:hypothetical protein [Candidatus Krumholzibacteria bacterium]